MPLCTKCKQVKDEDSFYIEWNGKLRRWCKDCYAKHNENYYANNTEKCKHYRMGYYQKNKDVLRERSRVAMQRYRAKVKAANEEHKQIVRQNAERDLKKMDFIYVNGYTFKAVDMNEAFKFEISGQNDEVAVLMPNDRAELMAKWLNLHLKGTD